MSLNCTVVRCLVCLSWHQAGRIGASAVILSPIASQERPNYRGMEEVTKEEDTYLRIFGKPTTRVNRRMGVVLCYAPLDSDLDTLRDEAKRIADRVEVY